jgi:hypothetical protein
LLSAHLLLLVVELSLIELALVVELAMCLSAALVVELVPVLLLQVKSALVLLSAVLAIVLDLFALHTLTEISAVSCACVSVCCSRGCA